MPMSLYGRLGPDTSIQILDPQSAVLTNSEVLSFMRAHPPRKPDPQIGGYPVTDMRGLLSVQREVY